MDNKTTYKIKKSDNGMLTITCPVCEIIPLRKELFQILENALYEEYKEVMKDGVYVFGQHKKLAEQFHCTSNNVTKILQRNGVSTKRVVNFG